MDSKEIKKEEVTLDEVVQEAPAEESKVNINPVREEDIVNYRFADSVISCKICGKDTSINHPGFINVETGVQLPFLRTNNDSFLALACEHCNSALTLRFIEAKTPPAYDLSYSGFDTPRSITLEWKGGEDVKTYKVYLEKLSMDDTQTDEDKSEFIGAATEPKMDIQFEENTSYRIRIDSIYDVLEEEVVVGTPVFISTEVYPEDIPENKNNETDPEEIQEVKE